MNTFTYVSNEHYKVYIDPLSELYLLGASIDYLKQDYTEGIYESKFFFLQDKKDVTACGCVVFIITNLLQTNNI